MGINKERAYSKNTDVEKKEIIYKKIYFLQKGKISRFRWSNGRGEKIGLTEYIQEQTKILQENILDMQVFIFTPKRVV